MFPPVISLAKYSLVASQAWAKSCRVATWATTISAILSRNKRTSFQIIKIGM